MEVGYGLVHRPADRPGDRPVAVRLLLLRPRVVALRAVQVAHQHQPRCAAAAHGARPEKAVARQVVQSFGDPLVHPWVEHVVDADLAFVPVKTERAQQQAGERVGGHPGRLGRRGDQRGEVHEEGVGLHPVGSERPPWCRGVVGYAPRSDVEVRWKDPWPQGGVEPVEEHRGRERDGGAPCGAAGQGQRRRRQQGRPVGDAREIGHRAHSSPRDRPG